MTTQGPPLESLTRRLAETPADFGAAPRIAATGWQLSPIGNWADLVAFAKHLSPIRNAE